MSGWTGAGTEVWLGGGVKVEVNGGGNCSNSVMS